MTHMLMKDQVEMSKAELGPVVMDFYATSLERGLAVRDQCDPARFIDVNHDSFVNDSMGVARQIYDHFELDLGEAAVQAMDQHIEANPKGQHGEHRYQLDDWGLTKEEVQTRFAPYIDRFRIDMG